MAHAWLDSLSEDWVSEPRSDTSQTQLPPLSSPQPKSSPNPASRIPRLNAGQAGPPSSPRPARDSSAHVLSERSMNDVNIKGAQRGPSKLSSEMKSSQRRRYLTRSISSTTGSVVRNTVQHTKSQSSSPTKGKEDVPEWKRRLIYGELNYGESKDLFSSAGTGLENIFRPPVVPDPVDEETAENEGHAGHDTTLPSSPPPYVKFRRGSPDPEESLEKSADESSIQHAAPPPKMTFRRTEDDSEDLSGDQDSFAEKSRDGQALGTNPASQNSVASLDVKQINDASRKTSGQSDGRNEYFSPILISCHNTENGQMSFAPVELPAQQLRSRLEMLRRNQNVLDPEPEIYVTQDSRAQGDETQNFENTDEYAKNGGFLNLQRGGRSEEGSFRQRPLSPPLITDTSEMLPESSLQASTPKQFFASRTSRITSADRPDSPPTPNSPILPRAPHPSPEKLLRVPASNGGSPLKLFGPYDTFTNQTLMRRISQFEDQMNNNPSCTAEGETNGLSAGQSSSKSKLSRSSATELKPRKGSYFSRDHQEASDAANMFGAGELDDYEFNEDISLGYGDRSHINNKENMTPLEMPSSHAAKFDIHQDLSADEESLIIQRARNNVRFSRPFEDLRPHTSSGVHAADFGTQETPQRYSSEGKRPRTSPCKDPTPKRRRTLHRSDIAYGLEERPAAIETVQSSHHDMQSAIGKKRKESRQSTLQQFAGSNMLAARPVLRSQPQSPTRRSSKLGDRQPLGNLVVEPDDQPSEISTEVRESEISVQDFAYEGSRKTSMKTQDFFDAAEEIMAMIRDKARPKTELEDVEESESESVEQRDWDESRAVEDSFQESTKEPFSRPPSREGVPVARVPAQQGNSELADRLKRYEERSDLGDIILTHSMQHMGRMKQANHRPNNVSDFIYRSVRPNGTLHGSDEEHEVISDLSNIRISRNPDHPQAGEHDPEYPSNVSRFSGASTEYSHPTTSSRGSDSRRLIGPDVVSQLIGDQVGNMVFDKENKKWKKVKTARPTSRARNILLSEDSEEDPFASIPDLSVDTAKETQNLGLSASQSSQDFEESLQEQDEACAHSSSTKTTSKLRGFHDIRSIMSHTRETFARIKQTMIDTAVEDDEEIEHEITIHEDRMQKSSPSRRRNLTITFSSPIASIIQDVGLRHSDDDKAEGDTSLSDQSADSIGTDSFQRGRRGRPKSAGGAATTSRSRSRSQGGPRSVSVKGRVFVPRPVSRIDEQDEDNPSDQGASVPHRNASGDRDQSALDYECQLSIRGESSLVGPEAEDNRDTSLSCVVATPAPNRTAPSASTPVIGRCVGNLSLTPLSEFTMHQVDPSCGLEVSYVVGDQYLVTGDGSKKILSKAIRNLVEKITEVEPFEPDWESMQELDLSGKHITTLHMLDEFCSSIVTLDASDNYIDHLDGVPMSVRNIRLTNNSLSELTAWGHLTNLQYVDISNNQINSLHAFKDLVHLRTLRADNNEITSLDGIKLHDSLQVLRARGNFIERIDFDGTKLQRLTELDLENNQINSIQNLEQLTCLSTLNLQHNRLASFAPGADCPMPCLKYLKLSNNDIVTLDVSKTPSLRLLHVDRNRLATITGFSRCRRLDSLSLREQNTNAPLDTSFLDHAYEVRKLFLSGNLLSSFNPRMDFLNLQYLELANCGLQSLPPDLGQLMPNLRVLNLNYNAIEDISALQYIPRLKKLLAAGNRLLNAGRVTDVLAGFPHLSRLDFRDNPATLGFYPPVQTLVRLERDGREGESDPFALPDVDAEREAKFSSRLDMGTRMRKRLYEMIVLDRCRQLRMLDGLPAARDATARRDSVWTALVASGIIDKGDGNADADAGRGEREGEEEEEEEEEKEEEEKEEEGPR
ncbi:hypothetical protein F5X99DRAFT_124705 [Biscogniauxia marginata]|nr:hypothetical protein F5X99DRAFT_124705 [Biscogniauxia marginata]